MALRMQTPEEGDPRPHDGPSPAPARSRNLRSVLVASDATVVAGIWLWSLGALEIHAGGVLARLAAVTVVVVTTLVMLASTRLYRARVCRVRSLEVRLLGRSTLMTVVLVHFARSPLQLDLPVDRALLLAGMTWAGLCLSRTGYASWLRQQRAGWRYTRPIAIVGTGEDNVELSRLLSDNPEFGFHSAGVVDAWSDVVGVLAERGCDSVLLTSGACGREHQRRLVNRLLDAGIHVHYFTGLRGIDHRRLRAQPIAREPMYYLERVMTSPWQPAVKRAVDIAGGLIALVVASPVLVLAAVAIKLDGGPVLYRQERIGRGGRPFRVFKLRTMVPHADRQLSLVLASNERNGPLFKSREDPRVTRVGRVLRATSIDELPQLLNVLQGSMSLVGPRPALAREIEHFDAELRARTRVRPGMTGLWQIEGRDSPSFDTYRRLDLHYLANWSLRLDFSIMLGTVQAVVTRAAAELCRRWSLVPTSHRDGPFINLGDVPPNCASTRVRLDQPQASVALDA
jgi:exopolysaccharide biosynthesis polyprenyl glycosylphosphotransferase